MASVNAQSVEDLDDRVIYRYPGGRYRQAATNFNGVFSLGLKTLVNTDTNRSYVVPASGLPARLYKVDLYITSAVELTENGGVVVCVIKCGFFRVSAQTLNYDGRSMQTEFYKEDTSNFIPSAQLRSINIGNIELEPMLDVSALQYTALSGFAFTNAVGGSALTAIIQPIVTMFKK